MTDEQAITTADHQQKAMTDDYKLCTGVVFAMIMGTIGKFRLAVCSLLATLTVMLMVSPASSSQSKL